MNVAEVQQLLGLDKHDLSPAMRQEVFAFFGWWLVSSLWYIPFLIIYAIIGWWLFF